MNGSHDDKMFKKNTTCVELIPVKPILWVHWVSIMPSRPEFKIENIKCLYYRNSVFIQFTSCHLFQYIFSLICISYIYNACYRHVLFALNFSITYSLSFESYW